MIRLFPVLLSYYQRRQYPQCPAAVAWDLVARHEAQALHNHSQSLETLARRGGLDPLELYFVLHDQPYIYTWQPNPVSMDQAVAWLQGLEAPPK